MITIVPPELKSLWDTKSSSVTLNPEDFSMFSHTVFNSTNFKPTTVGAILSIGNRGNLLNNRHTQVYISRLIPQGTFYDGPSLSDLQYNPSSEITLTIGEEDRVPPAILDKIRRNLHPLLA